MGKILSLLLGLAVLLGVVRYVLEGTASKDGTGTTPPQKLQNARDAAKHIEAVDQQRADEALERGKAE